MRSGCHQPAVAQNSTVLIPTPCLHQALFMRHCECVLFEKNEKRTTKPRLLAVRISLSRHHT